MDPSYQTPQKENQPAELSERHGIGRTLFIILLSIVVILVPGVLSYTYIHSRQSAPLIPVSITPSLITSKSATALTPSASPAKKQILTPRVTPTATPTPISPTPSFSLSVSPTGTPQIVTYFDPSGYSVELPSNWTGFIRSRSDDASQTGFHEVGSSDAPIVINVYKNTGLSVSEGIDSRFGSSYPRTQKTLDGKTVTIVTTAAYTSYFFSENESIFEVSEAVGNPAFDTITQQLLQTFTIV